MYHSLCVICSQPVPLQPLLPLKILPGSDGSQELNETLIVYFIAKKLLKLEDNKCLQIVEAIRNASFRLCESCEVIVSKAVECHQKILDLEKEILVLGDSLSHIISLNGGSAFHQGTVEDPLTLTPKDGNGIVKLEAGLDSMLDDKDDGHEDFFAEDGPCLPEGKDDDAMTTATIKKSGSRKRNASDDQDSDYDPGKEEATAKKGKLRRMMMAGSRKKYLFGKYSRIKIDKKKTHFPCTFCSTVYSSPLGFKRHLVDHEKSDRLGNIFDCPKCKHPNLSEMKLRRHLTIRHETSRNTCHICGHVAMRRWLHDKHMLKKHNVTTWKPIQAPPTETEEEIQKTYNCELCESVYTTAPGFKKHLGIHQESRMNGGKFDCKICKYPNVTLHGLKKHLSTIHGQNLVDDDDKGQEKLKKDEILESIIKESEDGEKEYHCTRCSSVFKTTPGFKRHIRNHEESKKLGGKFDCSICRHPNLSLHAMKKHFTEIHDQDTRDEDNAILSILTAEKIRGIDMEQVVETEEKNDNDVLSVGPRLKEYPCMRCSFVHMTLPGLTRHNFLHEASDLLGNKFDCGICGHPTTSETNLRRHFAEVHESVGESYPFDLFMKHDREAEASCHSGDAQKAELGEGGERPQTASLSKSSIKTESYGADKIRGDDSEWLPDSDAQNGPKVIEVDDDDGDDDDDDDFYEKLQKEKRRSMTLSSESDPNPNIICKICNHVYLSPLTFQRHLDQHEESARLNHKFDCGKCGYPANCERRLAYHMKVKHGEKPIHSCNICDYKTFKKTYLKYHMIKHTAGYQKKKVGRKSKVNETGSKRCTKCPATYESRISYRRHLEEHRRCEEAGSEFDCDLCNFPCRDEVSLRRHKFNEHEDIGDECQICHKKFPRKKYLRDHLAVHKRYDKLKDETGLYQCPLCPYKAVHLQGFVIHKNVNHEDLCLDDPDDVEIHLCTECGRTFNTQALLDAHKKEKHENKVRYSCDICGKEFKKTTYFRNHMKTHDKNRTKEYVCSCCGATYSTNKWLKNHMARFHPDQLTHPQSGYGSKAEKPGHHKCKWCEQVFPFKYLLVNHIPTAHKDLYKFSCDICNKAYISASSLRLHKEINHSDGTLRYSCEYCGKGGYVHRHNVLCHHKHCSVKKQGGQPQNQTASATDNPSEVEVKSTQVISELPPPGPSTRQWDMYNLFEPKHN